MLVQLGAGSVPGRKQKPSAALIYYLDGNRGGKNNIPERLSPCNPHRPQRPRAVREGQGEVGARGVLLPWKRRAPRGFAPAKNQHLGGAVLTGGAGWVRRSSCSLFLPTRATRSRGPLLSITVTAAGRAGSARCRAAQLSAARGRSLPALPFAYLGPCEARCEPQLYPPSFLEVRTAPPQLSKPPGSTLRVVSGREAPGLLSVGDLRCHQQGSCASPVPPRRVAVLGDPPATAAWGSLGVVGWSPGGLLRDAEDETAAWPFQS